MRKCTVCEHDQIASIDRFLVKERGSKSQASVRYGLSESAIQRHRREHLGLVTRSTKRENTGSGRPTKRDSQRTDRFATGACPACGREAEDDRELDAKEIIREARSVLRIAKSIALDAQEDNDANLVLRAIDRVQKSVDSMAKIGGLTADIVIDQRQQVNIYASWSTAALQALQAFHDELNAGRSITDALEAVQRLGNGKPKALNPAPTDNA